MATKQEYIDSLKWRYNSISNEIVDLQGQIRDMFSLIEVKQIQIQNLFSLLKSEGENLESAEGGSATSVSISEIVYNFMKDQEAKIPMHYTDITQHIMSKGILIPGKNPASNLLSNINRDERFIRTAPGTYGLQEWGIKPMVSRKRKSRNSKVGK